MLGHRRPALLPRLLRRAGLALLVLLALLLLTFALPIKVWRTGERPAPPLPLVSGGPRVDLTRRVWIDTDAACGQNRTTDPDDCFAILLVAGSRELEVVGISTVAGNAPLPISDSITRALTAELSREGRPAPPVFRGSSASAAIRSALDEGPLTFLALGPLTNLAAALREGPEAPSNLARLVAVMGRRPGHLFHPGEGSGEGILFGHGPVFSDFNFDQDRAAAAAVLSLDLPTTLIPYEAAREVSLGAADLARLETARGAAEWVAARSREWLDFWQEDVGRDGFYPFDLLAAAYVLEPSLFDCAGAEAWIAPDERLWSLFNRSEALLVGTPAERPDSPSIARTLIYCPEVDLTTHGWLVRRLVD